MAAVTFEPVLTPARQLTPQQRAQLIGALAQGLAQLTPTAEELSLAERREVKK